MINNSDINIVYLSSNKFKGSFYIGRNDNIVGRKKLQHLCLPWFLGGKQQKQDLLAYYMYALITSIKAL